MTRPFSNQLSVISEKSMDFDCVVTIEKQNDQNDNNILERLSLISSKHSEEDLAFTIRESLSVNPSPRLPIGRRRNLSLCEIPEVQYLVPRLSLPSILRRESSKTSVSSTDSIIMFY